MVTPPTNLDIEKLAARCRQETSGYLTGRGWTEEFCLELFRRAVMNNDQSAWQAIYLQYRRLVADWVRQHRSFVQTNEEADFFVNAAFMRFWQGLSQQNSGPRLDGFAGFLQYLKSCVHSAIADENRRQQRWPPDAVAWNELSEGLPDVFRPSLEEHVIGRVQADALAWALMSRLRNEQETVVATLSWIYGCPPREIQARYPQLFPDVARVHRVKQNILNRLLRDPEFHKFVINK